MRADPLLPGFSTRFALLCLAAAALPALAQPTAAPRDEAPAAAQAPAAPARGRPEQRVERLHVEDGGSRVDEVRYGGQTQSITVQPKAAVPEYRINPTDGARQRPAARDGAETDAGQRMWNVRGF